MPLLYIVPINITVVGDGESFDLVVDLAKDYVYVAETGYTTFKKLPASAAPIASTAMGYEAKLLEDGKLLVHFPSPPAPNAPYSVNINLFFEGDFEAVGGEGTHPALVGGQVNG